MSSKMRNEGIAYVKEHFGEIEERYTTVSQFYDDITKKSYAKRPSWGNEISLEKLKENKDIHIICEHENGDGFYYFRVPAKDIKDMLEKDKLGFNKEQISLSLSAQPEDRFQDLRGKGKVDFSRYLQEKKKD